MLLPTSISLVPQRIGFWNHQPRTKLLDVMFSEMHVKEQGLVKLRSKFALQGFHSSVSAATQSELSQSGSCGGTATLFRSHLAISHPFGSIQPGAAGFDWSSMTLLLKGTPVMFVSDLPYLQHGHRRRRTFRNFQRSALMSRMQAYPSSLQEIGTCRRPNCWSQAGPPVLRGRFCFCVIWKSRANLEGLLIMLSVTDLL